MVVVYRTQTAGGGGDNTVQARGHPAVLKEPPILEICA